MGGFEGLISERHVQLLLAFIRHLKAWPKEHIQITNWDRCVELTVQICFEANVSGECFQGLSG